jgi:hypothetical protein
MKKFYTILLATFFNAAAEPTNIEQFKAQFKLLDNKIRIVKLKDFMNVSIRDEGDKKQVLHSIESMRNTKKEMDEKGYVFKPSPYINFLLHEIKDEGIRHEIQSKSSELSDTLDGFKIGYDYKPISSSFYNKHWGFSPMGGYNRSYESVEKEGWNGVVEYFDKEDLTCSYSEHNTKLAHGGNELVEELITYNVNNKPTIELVTKDISGFLYKVEWFQKDFDRTLECVSTAFSKDILEQVKTFAQELDKR